MSSYDARAREPEKFMCKVGYDRGVDSYFVYFARHLKTQNGRIVGEHNGHVVAHFGTTEREITSVEELVRLTEPFAEIDERILEALRKEVERQKPSKQLVAIISKGVSTDGR